MKLRIRESMREHFRTLGPRRIAFSYLQILAGCLIAAASYPFFQTISPPAACPAWPRC